MRVRGWTFVACLSASSFAFGTPVILVPRGVVQYEKAAQAAAKHLGRALVLDPSDPGLAAQLKTAEVVVAVGQKAINASRLGPKATPVVFCMVVAPRSSQLAENVTGVPLEPNPAEVLRQLLLVFPGMKRLGTVFEPGVSDAVVQEARRAAVPLGVTLVLRPVHSGTDMREAVSSLDRQVDAVWLPINSKLITPELVLGLIGWSAERKLPLVGFLDSFTQAGALASVSPNYTTIGDRAGKLAAELVGRDRSKPLPSAVFVAGDLTLNVRTANALGVELSPTAMSAAKQVFR